MSNAILSTWTIYDHPRDAPDHVVVRRWQVMDVEVTVANLGNPFVKKSPPR